MVISVDPDQTPSSVADVLGSNTVNTPAYMSEYLWYTRYIRKSRKSVLIGTEYVVHLTLSSSLERMDNVFNIIFLYPYYFLCFPHVIFAIL